MIEFLSGRLAQKDPTHLILNVNGVGYGMDVSLKTSDACPPLGEALEIFTFLYVKEGIFDLYGFLQLIEKKLFLHLISVSGIGPKVALRILSGLSPESLVQKVLDGDVNELVAIKGIGKKTAEVMVASLRSPLGKLNLVATAEGSSSSQLEDATDTDAIQALMTLGVKENVARKAVLLARKSLGDNPETSQLISTALQKV